MIKLVVKRLKLPTFLAVRPKQIDSWSTMNHDQMSSTAQTVDRVLKASGVGRY